jgi:hypothetical protein
MLTYRDHLPYEIKDAMNILGEPYATKYIENEGLLPEEMPDFIKKLGVDPLQDIYFPRDFKSALEMYGMIYVSSPPEGALSSMNHTILLTAMGDPTGDCKDPVIFYWDPLGQNPSSYNGQWELPWSLFISKYYSNPYAAMYVSTSQVT